MHTVLLSMADKQIPPEFRPHVMAAVANALWLPLSCCPHRDCRRARRCLVAERPMRLERAPCHEMLVDEPRAAYDDLLQAVERAIGILASDFPVVFPAFDSEKRRTEEAVLAIAAWLMLADGDWGPQVRRVMKRWKRTCAATPSIV
ncbi:hypothetical protein [Sinorhizobium sp. BG8]|uniref:hypothetical protein n=1 Tax=Sinorhizobium sp. BG8 TaxID=2613773 RepID=UPI00193CA012|nr:hypothetical protein [Sinorhizobium sp. BG8]QRM55741.1 hypothetical protein F3Y30_15300 [Sinorhizobium sp. BG8]